MKEQMNLTSWLHWYRSEQKETLLRRGYLRDLECHSLLFRLFSIFPLYPAEGQVALLREGGVSGVGTGVLFFPVESYQLGGDASCQLSMVHENAFVEFFSPGNLFGF